MNRQAGMFNRAQLIACLAAAAMIGLAAAPSAHAAFTVIAIDEVDAVGNYTYTDSVLGAGATSATGGVDNGAYVRFSHSSGVASTSSARFTAGFGESITVEAGTYRLSAHSGRPHSRTAWTTFDPKLMTTAGTEWADGDKSVVTEYVMPTVVGSWALAEVEYVIPAGHALIGMEFTWGFTATKPAGAYFVGFDLATVKNKVLKS